MPEETKPPKLYTLTVTEKQARVLSRSLNVWGRALGGQLHHVGHEIERWVMPARPGPEATADERALYDVKQERLQMLSTLLLGLNTLVTGCNNHRAGHGIYSPEMPGEAKAAYDLDKAIRRCLWEANGREPGWSVDADPPLLSGTEPLALVETASPGSVERHAEHQSGIRRLARNREK